MLLDGRSRKKGRKTQGIVALTFHGPLPCPGTCSIRYTIRQPSVSDLWSDFVVRPKKRKSHVSGILFSSLGSPRTQALPPVVDGAYTDGARCRSRVICKGTRREK